MAYGVWCMAYDVRSMVYGLGSMVYGLWRMCDGGLWLKPLGLRPAAEPPPPSTPSARGVGCGLRVRRSSQLCLALKRLSKARVPRAAASRPGSRRCLAASAAPAAPCTAAPVAARHTARRTASAAPGRCTRPSAQLSEVSPRILQLPASSSKLPGVCVCVCVCVKRWTDCTRPSVGARQCLKMAARPPLPALPHLRPCATPRHRPASSIGCNRSLSHRNYRRGNTSSSSSIII